jgi:hypothetical protein
VRRASPAWALRLTAILLAATLVGCATARSTRVTVEDFSEMSNAMAQSLARSPWLDQRNPASEPITVSIEKVQNLSSDVMTQSEQWYVIQKLRSSLPITALWDQKAVRFVIPPEKQQLVRQDAALAPDAADYGSQRRPTHLMSATFRSITRADATNRTDLYYCEFEILDLATRLPVWTDKFEFKRAAAGHVLD